MLSTSPAFILVVCNVYPRRTNVRDIILSVLFRKDSHCAAHRNLVYAVSDRFRYLVSLVCITPGRFRQRILVLKLIHLQPLTVTLYIPITTLQEGKRFVRNRSLEVLETERRRRELLYLALYN